MQADALVNCLQRQLESDAPGSAAWAARVDARLRWLVSVVCNCREPFCLTSYSCTLRESCRRAANVGRMSWCDLTITKHGLRSGENTR